MLKSSGAPKAPLDVFCDDRVGWISLHFVSSARIEIDKYMNGLSRMLRWSALAGAAVHLLAAVPAGAQQIPMDETGFTAFVAERMRKEIQNLPVVIKGPLTLSIGPLQANLDRVYAFCKANAAGCSGEIGVYIRGTAESARNKDDLPARDAIRVVVRTTDYMQKAAVELGPEAAIPTKPLVEGLVIVPVLDSPRTVRMLNGKHRDRLGLSPAQVFDVGVANLRRNVKPLMEVAKPATPGRFGSLSGDFYQTSRLALVDSWAPLAQAQGGVLIVAVPAADTLLYSGEDSGAAIDALRTLARNIMSRSPKPLSGALLRWTPRGWQLVR
jgi:hypothetical protein